MTNWHMMKLMFIQKEIENRINAQRFATNIFGIFRNKNIQQFSELHRGNEQSLSLINRDNVHNKQTDILVFIFDIRYRDNKLVTRSHS